MQRFAQKKIYTIPPFQRKNILSQSSHNQKTMITHCNPQPYDLSGITIDVLAPCSRADGVVVRQHDQTEGFVGGFRVVKVYTLS